MIATYVFVLTYWLPEEERDASALVERLAGAGCDDALVGTGQVGRIALEFSRDGASAEAALHSALVDVRQAIPTARLIEAAPDYVGLSDVAGLVGVSRQYLRKLMLNHAASFPSPVHGGAASIWHLADLLEWLSTNRIRPVSATDLDLARAARDVNLARAASRLSTRAARQLENLVA